MFIIIVSGSLLLGGILYVLYKCHKKQDRDINLFGSKFNRSNSLDKIINYNKI